MHAREASVGEERSPDTLIVLSFSFFKIGAQLIYISLGIPQSNSIFL